MKLLAYLLLATGLYATSVNVQKDNVTSQLTSSVVAGNGVAISATGTGTNTATAAPWAGVTGTPTTLTGYGVTNTLGTTAPLVGGAALSTNPTISIPAATTSVNGYLTAADWTTFNGKQSSGNYLTALTGDVTATGPGSASSTVTRLNGVSLAGLATGIVKNTTATGVPSIAIAGTDYLAPSGNGSGITALNATQLTTGTVPTARLYTTAVGYNITGGAALDALGAVATSGGLYRTAANTYAARTLTGTAGQITVTNGDGVSGAPTFSLPTAITGVNSLTSAAASNLTLGTGTFGTAVTIASATGAATFASTAASTSTTTGALTVGGGIGVAGAGWFGTYLSLGNSESIEAATGINFPVGLAVTSNLLFFGDGARGGMVRGYQDGSNISRISTGHWASATDTFTAALEITQSATLANNLFAVLGTSPSTSRTTGALTVAGGIGVAGGINAGGSVTATKADTAGLISAFSGGAGNFASYQLGRVGTDFEIGVAGLANQFITGTSPGDAVLKTSTRNLYIGTVLGGSTYAVRFAATNGDAFFASTTDATTGGAGSLSTAGGIYAAKQIIGATGILSFSPTAGIGYTTGAGGTVTQATSRTTGVTLNQVSGAITLFTAIGSVTATSFTVTNSAVAITDTISLSVRSGTNKYLAFVTTVAAGSFEITFYTTGGVSSDAPVISFNVIKGTNS
jgi:hypothetical protein